MPIIKELHGEKIDLIPYSTDPIEFIANALSPAKVEYVSLDEVNKEALVIVPDDALSLAIGAGGLNVKLASKLTGWKLDVKSTSQANSGEENETDQTVEDKSETETNSESDDDIFGDIEE